MTQRKASRHTKSTKELTRAEKSRRGAVIGYRVLALNAFFGVKDKEMQTFVAEQLGYNESERTKFKPRWSKWLNNLPSSGGRLKDAETPHLQRFIERYGMLPHAVLENLTQIFPGILYHALGSRFRMKSADLGDIRRRFCGEYNVFRYSATELNRIAVGALSISYNDRSKSIDTLERYKTGGEKYEIAGHLFQLPDSTYRVFGIHNYDRPQVLSIKHVDWYSSGDSPDKTGQARKMTGFFTDRNRAGIFYAGMIGIRRIDTEHPKQKIGTMNSKSLARIDPEILESLRCDDRRLGENLIELGR